MSLLTLLKQQEQRLWNCSVRRKKLNGASVTPRERTRQQHWKIVLKTTFGQWATDEVSGDQDHIDDERSCFWTWDHNEYGSPDHSRAAR